MSWQPCYATEPVPWDDTLPSLFLAGPTPRRPEVPSWRPDALRILDAWSVLDATRFTTGLALVPESRDRLWHASFLDQVEWEDAAMARADVLAFWVPRDLTTLPGLTTNVEFGRYVASDRVVYGRPDGAPATAYLDWLYGRCGGGAPCLTLASTLAKAVLRAGARALARRTVS